MGRPDSVRTAIIDAALSNTTVEDGQALAALCDCHVSATRAACQSRHHLLDFEEYRDAGVAL